MEHRFNYRQPVTCQVALYYRNQCISPSCRVRDVGRGGAFVEVSARDADIPLGALVSLVWQEPDDGYRHVEGLVVHHTSQGMGLMFRDEQVATLLIDTPDVQAQNVRSLE